MTSKTTLDTYSLRIHELVAINPATQEPIANNQILTTSTMGELVWVSTFELLDSITIGSSSGSGLQVAQQVQPGLSTMSTINSQQFISTASTLSGSIVASNDYITNLPISSILISTVAGLGSMGYLSSTDVSLPSFSAYKVILKQNNPSTINSDMFIANCVDYGSSIWMVGGQMNTTGTQSTGIIKRSFNGFHWESLSTNCLTRVNDLKFVSGYDTNTGPAIYHEFWMATGYTNGTGEQAVQVSTDGGNSWISTTYGATNITEGFVIHTNFNSTTSTTYVAVGGTTGVGASNNLYTAAINQASTNNFAVNTTLSTFTTINDVMDDFVLEGVNVLVGASFGLPLGTYAFYDLANAYQISSFYLNKVYGIARDTNGNQMAVGHLAGLDDIYTASNFGTGWQLGEKVLDDGDVNFIKYINGFWIVGGTSGVKVNPTGALGSWSNVPMGLEQARDIAYNGIHYLLVGKPSTLMTTSNAINKSILISDNLSTFKDFDITITSTTLTISTGNLYANGAAPIQMSLINRMVANLGSSNYISTFVNYDALSTSTLEVSSITLFTSTPGSLISLQGISTIYALEYANTNWLAGGYATEGPIMNISQDNGATWSSITRTLQMSTIYSLAYGPLQSRWWAGGSVNGVLSTGTLAYSDNGVTDWQSIVDSNLKMVNVNAIYVTPNSQTTYVAGRTDGTANPFNFVYYDGVSLVPRNVQRLIEVYTIHFDADSETLFIGGRCDPFTPITSTIGNFQISYDFGSSWLLTNPPLAIVYDIGVKGGRVIAVGTDTYGNDSLTIAVSGDGGYTWDSGTDFGALVNQVRPKIKEFNGVWIVSGSQLLKSTNNGISWVTAEPTTFTSLPALQSNANQILAGGEYNGGNIVVRSTDTLQWSTSIYTLPSTTLKLASDRLYVNGSLALRQGEVVSSIQQLGTFGYVSTLSPTFNDDMTSTTLGLGSAGYFSSFNTSTLYNDFSVTELQITTPGVGNFLLTTNGAKEVLVNGLGDANRQPLLTLSSMYSTINGLGQIGFMSTANAFPQFFDNLSSSNYISTSQFQSTILNNLNIYKRQVDIQSTVEGLGSAGYISTPLTSFQYVCRTSTLAFEGEILSTSVFDSSITLSSLRVNLSSFAELATSQTTLRVDLKTNLSVSYPFGLQQGMQLQNYFTYGDDTTLCGPVVSYNYPATTSSFFLPSMTFVLNAGDINTTFPSTLSLHHHMSTGTNDQGVFKNISPLSGTIRVLLNNI